MESPMAAQPSSSAPSDPVYGRLNIQPLFRAAACSQQYVRWSYTGTQSSSANLTIFTSTSNFPTEHGVPVENSAQQTQVISDTVPINIGYFNWSPVNVPPGTYKLQISVPDSHLSSTSSLFDILSSSNTKCLSSTSIKYTGNESEGEIDGSRASGSGDGASTKLRTVVPAIAVPVFVIGMLALTIIYWRRKHHRHQKALSARIYRSSALPPLEGPYRDAYDSATAAGSKRLPSPWSERLGGFPSPKSPPRATSTQKLNDNDSGAFGYADAYAYSIRDNNNSSKHRSVASYRNDPSQTRDKDSWSDFENDDAESRASDAFEDTQDGGPYMPKSPAGVYHHFMHSAASDRPASLQHMQMRPDALVAGMDAHLIDPQVGTGGYAHAHGCEEPSSPRSPSSPTNHSFSLLRKPVPTFAASRDASAAYAADGHLNDVDGSPAAGKAREHDFFADTQAPAAAFTVARHHDSSPHAISGGVGVNETLAHQAATVGKAQHQLAVNGPVSYF
ncbi:hypothetical protein K437DRAFT_252892 [Tilletiaria anomala UBC 951]|uniref:Uncharacterized protein n=1 Tax=Tilletiaria anomala (strain ATCC 24038 / CBS 436.72 / UBC 951) TaxID=1037660 RepID=A0A066WS68_TILAU|nr:uncharacterized protein K437DRAFT_252892 [Tilletiaria anomala UBC 951]KDN53530.1 hypothetical protein K437DRAFT_252892 [Tilletiaria anomala UBC 951]